MVGSGGFSWVFPQPAYQAQAVAQYLATGPNMPPLSMFNATGRMYPDVAVMGHSYITVGGGQYSGADGTSASAPVFAGMITVPATLPLLISLGGVVLCAMASL